MGTTKERLEDLEKGLGLVQDELQKLNTGINDKFQGMETRQQTMETSLAQILEVLATHNRPGESDTTSATQPVQPTSSSIPLATTTHLSATNPQPENNAPPPPFPPHVMPPLPPFQPPQMQPPYPHQFPLHPPQMQPPYPHQYPQPHRHIKLDFPRFHGGDPTEWLSKAKQYFAYQGIPRANQVSFASYHLTQEANEWWLATAKALGLDPNATAWETFEEELWVRFGPTEGENFHEALSHIHQTGSFRDYQKEFERLMNKVENWSEAALVGTFIGGLTDAIADNVRMFSPTTLREVIKLCRLRDEQLQKQKKVLPQRSNSQPANGQGITSSTPVPKKLSWDDMKRKRALGLCFSCDERYTPGHMCKTSQLLLMIGEDEEEEDEDEMESFQKQNLGDKIHLGQGSNDRVTEPNRHVSNQTKFPNRNTLRN